MKIEHITCFESDKVSARFSLKNDQVGKSDVIPGLNVGYNTVEEKEVADYKRMLWFQSLGLDIDSAAWGIQIHGDTVQEVEKPGVYEKTDGLVTNLPNLSLNIFVADCAALLFWDEINGVIGACHAGWRGAVAGIVPNTVQMMTLKGAKSNAIKVFVSPCISVKHFEVGEEVATQFPETYVNRSFEKPHVDLKSFIYHQLTESGIEVSNIKMHDGCTFSEPHNYYSYRWDGQQAGRMIATIVLKSKG